MHRLRDPRRLFVFHDGADEHAEDRQNYSCPKCGHPSVDRESGHHLRGEQDHGCVDDDEKDAECEDGEWEGDDLHGEAKRRVERADDDGGEHRRAHIVDIESRDELGCDDYGDGAQDPMDKRSKHAEFFSRCGGCGVSFNSYR